ncbi:MAG: hypothetical protein ACN4GR_07795 [Arenicellales bacterium]
MADKKSNDSRRKLLKSIAAGSGVIVAGKSLPESWSRPIVDSVILPVHAQTSGGPFAGNATTTTPTLGTDSVFAQAADALIPQARANGVILPPYVCVEPDGSLNKALVKLYYDASLYTFEDVPVSGFSCSYTRSSLCDANAGDLLRGFGLIKDAHAVADEICCYLDSVNGTGVGRIVFTEGAITVNFAIGPDSCNPPNPCLD